MNAVAAFFDSLPPALVPVVVAVAAAVIGGILWRLFKLALKLVAIVVFTLIGGALLLWKFPQLQPKTETPSSTSAPSSPSSSSKPSPSTKPSTKP